MLRGRERLAVYGPEENAAARELFARAVALDPEYALAHAFLALAIFNEEWGEHVARERAACLEHANLAARLDPTDSRCHRILAMILIFVLGVSLWLAYGVMVGAWPIVIANAITLALAGLILIMKLRFQRQEPLPHPPA